MPVLYFFLETVKVFLDGSQHSTLEVTSGADEGASLWRQHPYKGTFSGGTLPRPAEEGSHTIRIETSANLAGNTGFAEYQVALTKQVIPGTGGSGSSLTLNLQLTQSLSETSIDQITFFTGTSVPPITPVILTETGIDTRVFIGVLEGMAVEATLTAGGLISENVDQIDGLITFSYGHGVAASYPGLLIETGATSGIFRKTIQVIDGGSGESVVWTASVSELTSNAGSYVPNSVRVKGIIDSDFRVNLVDSSTNVALQEDGSNQYIIKGGSVNYVVVVPDPAGGDGLSFIYYDDDGHTAKKEAVPQSKSMKVALKDFPTASATVAKAKADLIDLRLDSPTPKQEFTLQVDPVAMPAISITVKDNPTIKNKMQYQFILGTTDTAGSRALEYEDAPSNYTHPAKFETTAWQDSRTWNIPWRADEIFGGHGTKITVKVKVIGAAGAPDVELTGAEIRTDFYIVGSTIPPATFDAYIQAQVGYGSQIRIMAKGIHRQETNSRHFWEGSGSGIAAHKFYPLRERKTPGGGYGLMQLTSPNLLSVASIWNWKTNIDTGFDRIHLAYTAGVTYLAQHPVAPANLDVWRRLEGYNRYNADAAARYFWWNDGTRGNGLPVGWIKFGYIPVGTNTSGWRDYNDNSVQDPDGNPYNIPGFSGGPSSPTPGRSPRYADQARAKEP